VGRWVGGCSESMHTLRAQPQRHRRHCRVSRQLDQPESVSSVESAAEWIIPYNYQRKDVPPATVHKHLRRVSAKLYTRDRAKGSTAASHGFTLTSKDSRRGGQSRPIVIILVLPSQRD
jgi:hypothetical protein